MRLRSGALGGSRDLLIPEPEIGGNRDLPDAYLGPAAFKGTYEFYARLESLDALMAGGFGSVSPAGPTSATVYTHTFTPIDQGSLPWFSVEEQIGDTFEVFRYTDAKVNTLHLEADANGYLMGSAGMVALSQIAVGSASATANPTFDTTPMIVGSNITVTWDALGTPQVLPSKKFSFDLNNNIEEDDFRLGHLTLGDAIEKRRDFQFGVTIRPEDDALWKTAMYGDPTATQVGGTVTKKGLKILCSTYEIIPGSSGGGVLYSVEFDVAKATIEPYAVNPSGDDIIEHDFTIRALRPSPGTAICTAIIKNGHAAPS